MSCDDLVDSSAWALIDSVKTHTPTSHSAMTNMQTFIIHLIYTFYRTSFAALAPGDVYIIVYPIASASV